MSSNEIYRAEILSRQAGYTLFNRFLNLIIKDSKVTLFICELDRHRRVQLNLGLLKDLADPFPLDLDQFDSETKMHPETRSKIQKKLIDTGILVISVTNEVPKRNLYQIQDEAINKLAKDSGQIFEEMPYSKEFAAYLYARARSRGLECKALSAQKDVDFDPQNPSTPVFPGTGTPVFPDSYKGSDKEHMSNTKKEERSDLDNAAHCPASIPAENHSNAPRIDSDMPTHIRTRKKRQTPKMALLNRNQAGYTELAELMDYLNAKDLYARMRKADTTKLELQEVPSFLSSTPRLITQERIDLFNVTSQHMADALRKEHFGIEDWKVIVDMAFESQWFLQERPNCFSLDGILSPHICKRIYEGKYTKKFAANNNRNKFNEPVNNDAEIF